jgi:hypothetical protein
MYVTRRSIVRDVHVRVSTSCSPYGVVSTVVSPPFTTVWKSAPATASMPSPSQSASRVGPSIAFASARVVPW